MLKFKKLKEKSKDDKDLEDKQIKINRERSADEITLVGEDLKIGRERSSDEITLIGEDIKIDREKSADEITLVGEDLEIDKQNKDEFIKENDLIKAISTGSIYFDALEEEEKSFNGEFQQDIENNLLKLKDQIEQKGKDDILITDEMWVIINALGKRYVEAISYTNEHEKMGTAEKFLMDKIANEKLARYYEKEVDNINKSLNTSTGKKFYNTLKVIVSFVLGTKSNIIKEIVQEVKMNKIRNKNTKESIKNILENKKEILKEKGINKIDVMKEIDDLKTDIKNSTTSGGYYYVCLRGIDKIDKDISYDAYQSKNIVMFDLSNPVKEKGGQYYFHDTPIDRERLCKGEDLFLKLVQTLREEDETFKHYIKAVDFANITNQIENLKDDGDYYVVLKGKDKDVSGVNPIVEKGNIKIYDLSNPLDFKDGKFYYGDYELDKNRLITVKQDKKNERVLNLLKKTERLIKSNEQKLETIKKDVNKLYDIGESRLAQNLEMGVEEIKKETELLKENLNKLQNIINEYSKEKENIREKLDELQTEINEYDREKENNPSIVNVGEEKKIKDMKSEVEKLSENLSEKSNKLLTDQQNKVEKMSKSLFQKSDKLFKYQTKISKEKLVNIYNDENKESKDYYDEDMKVKRASGFRKITEKGLFYALGIDDSKGVLNGFTKYLVDVTGVSDLQNNDSSSKIEKMNERTNNLENKLKKINQNTSKGESEKHQDIHVSQKNNNI